jgi:hypothetical protein
VTIPISGVDASDPTSSSPPAGNADTSGHRTVFTPPAAEFPRWATAVAFALVLALLVTGAMRAFDWYQRGYFTFDDGLIDTDPLANLTALAHGWGRRTLVHPHLASLFAIPIRVLEKGAALFAPVEAQKFREQVALCIAPLASAISGLFFWGIARRTCSSATTALLVLAVYLASFTVQAFASVPEAFPISNALITATLFYAVRLRDERAPGSRWLWACLAAGVMSITVTNIVPFAAIHLLHRRLTVGDAWAKGVRCTALLCVPVALLVLFSAQLVIVLLDYQQEATRAGIGNYVESFVSFQPGEIFRKLVTLALAFGQTFIATTPTTHDLRFCGDLAACRGVGFLPQTFDGMQLAGAMGILAVVSVAAARVLRTRNWQLVPVASVAIVAFNVGLHSVFGTEMVLFSSHWVTALTLLLTTMPPKRVLLVSLPVLALELASNTAALEVMAGLIRPLS